MMNHPNLYSEERTVKFLEVDGSRRMTVKSLCNCLQEAAYNSSAMLGTSIDAIHGENVTWVYSRFMVKVAAYPEFGEALKVFTWRSRFEENTAFREFIVEDASGSSLVKATAGVTLIDIATRKPAPIPETMRNQFAPGLGSAAVEQVEKLTEPVSTINEMEFRIRSSDLDINGHVNNAAYIEFMSECVPGDVILAMRPCEIAVNFLAEVHYGEGIMSQSCPCEKAGGDGSFEFLHRLVRAGDGRTVTRGRTLWRPFG